MRFTIDEAHAKAQKLVELEGFDNTMDLIKEIVSDSIAPGICVNPWCEYTTSVEPDSNSGWCEECKTNTVYSIFVLEGII